MNLAKTDKDEFLRLKPEVTNMDILVRFCCGLDSLVATLFIQDFVHNISYSDVFTTNSEDVCLLGFGPRHVNPYKEPLVLLFESEIGSLERKEDCQDCDVKHMHGLLKPLVKTIQMKCKNWPCRC